MKLEFSPIFGMQESEYPVDKTKTVHGNLLTVLSDKELFPKETCVFVNMEPTNWIPGEHDETDMVAFKTTAPLDKMFIVDFFVNGDFLKYNNEIFYKQCGWILVQAYPDFKKVDVGYY